MKKSFFALAAILAVNNANAIQMCQQVSDPNAKYIAACFAAVEAVAVTVSGLTGYVAYAKCAIGYLPDCATATSANISTLVTSIKNCF
jgi:hypothetical protein